MFGPFARAGEWLFASSASFPAASQNFIPFAEAATTASSIA